MALPKQVQKQSEEVQELYKELNGEVEAQGDAPEAEANTNEAPVEERLYPTVSLNKHPSLKPRSKDNQTPNLKILGNRSTKHCRVCTTQRFPA